jgi:Glycosyl hydrolase family 63 N-terminal domain
MITRSDDFSAGVRSRSMNPLVAGLMWGAPKPGAHREIRHEAFNEHGLETFGWHHHDLRSFGQQTIIDGPLNISTTFLKQPSDSFGGDWVLRMSVSRADKGTSNVPFPGEVHLQDLYVYIGQQVPPSTSRNQTQDAGFQTSLDWGLQVCPENCMLKWSHTHVWRCATRTSCQYRQHTVEGSPHRYNHHAERWVSLAKSNFAMRISAWLRIMPHHRHKKNQSKTMQREHVLMLHGNSACPRLECCRLLPSISTSVSV